MEETMKLTAPEKFQNDIPAKEACIRTIFRGAGDLLEKKQLRVAAYCRVSTDTEAQNTSLETQIAAFRQKIAQRPGWKLVDVYADEGITGTSTKKRKAFQRMLASPFMLVTALAIKGYDKGPAFYKQVRLTKDGRKFSILNLRWMEVVHEPHKIQARIRWIIGAKYTTFWLPSDFRHSIAGFAGVFAD